MSKGVLALVISLGSCLVACDDGSPAPDAGTDAGATSVDAGIPLPTTLGPSDRPARLVVPDAYDGTTPLPVILLLHGYGADANAQDFYFGLSRQRGSEFYLILPDGTVDESGKRFWNATDQCCDFDDSGVDDVSYLLGLLDELETLAPVATGQTFLLGHSNGGFMSYRLACTAADRFAAFISLAGSDYFDETECVPSQPVSMLQIHGDADATVLYEGGDNLVSRGTGPYRSAEEIVDRWASRSGCDTMNPTTGERLDLDMGLDGEETAVTRYDMGCSATAELWTIEGGAHLPALARTFTPRLLDWFRAHGR